jgi:hypothetical protein
MLARVIVLLSAFALCASGANLILAQNGKSDYTIVISTEASPSERHAAEELQKFVEQISGAQRHTFSISRVQVCVSAVRRNR